MTAETVGLAGVTTIPSPSGSLAPVATATGTPGWVIAVWLGAVGATLPSGTGRYRTRRNRGQRGRRIVRNGFDRDDLAGQGRHLGAKCVGADQWKLNGASPGSPAAGTSVEIARHVDKLFGSVVLTVLAANSHTGRLVEKPIVSGNERLGVLRPCQLEQAEARRAVFGAPGALADGIGIGGCVAVIAEIVGRLKPSGGVEFTSSGK